MSVAELVLLAYGLAALTGAFLAGHAWVISGPRGRALAVVLALTGALTFAWHLGWDYHLLARSFYWVQTLTVTGWVAAGCLAVLVALGTAARGRGWLVPFFLAGATALSWTIVQRSAIWPTLMFWGLALVGAAILVLIPRRGPPRPFRTKQWLWVLVGLGGLGSLVEGLGAVGLVAGVRIFGTATLFGWYTSSILLLVLLGRVPSPVGGPTTIPWEKFQPPLTPREADLVVGLRDRLTNKELATRAGVGESTVKKHLVQVFRKAGVSTRIELLERLDTD